MQSIKEYYVLLAYPFTLKTFYTQFDMPTLLLNTPPLRPPIIIGSAKPGSKYIAFNKDPSRCFAWLKDKGRCY